VKSLFTRTITGTLIVALASSAGAQVGYPPDKSPYQDRDYNRDWTFFAGHFDAQTDPVGVAPREGPMAGAKWQMHMTGPIYFGARLAGGSIERTVIDPSKRIEERVVGTDQVPMAFLDAALEMSLTGHKTWHGIAPYFNGGFGVVADLRGDTDVGGYRFGIPFSMTFGAGLSWAIARNWSLRFDWSNYIYRVGYPNSYYLKTTEDPPVLPQGAARSYWTRNPSLTVGISLFKPR
jgi:opacity protein-like surface antigen